MKNHSYKNENRSIYYPPGGILLWLIVAIELLTFIIGIAVFLHSKQIQPEVFAQAQATLNKAIGTFNTAILITGGFFMATALHHLKAAHNAKSLLRIRLAGFLGLVFLIVKSYEYYEKIIHGHVFRSNEFFTFYWMLTGFHFIHVIVGVVILFFLARGIHKGEYNSENYLDVASGGIFWHMCDLIWILLFPVLYLMP